MSQGKRQQLKLLTKEKNICFGLGLDKNKSLNTLLIIQQLVLYAAASVSLDLAHKDTYVTQWPRKGMICLEEGVDSCYSLVSQC